VSHDTAHMGLFAERPRKGKRLLQKLAQSKQKRQPRLPFSSKLEFDLKTLYHSAARTTSTVQAFQKNEGAAVLRPYNVR